VMVIKDFMSAK